MKRFALAAALWLVASPAEAYLIDLNDARVVDYGSMELELQPVGYYQLLVGEEEHYLIAPSTQIYFGIAPDWDLLYLRRGYVGLGDTAQETPYSVAEQFLGVRRLLIDGSYSSEGEREGPSLALQAGIFLPGFEAEEGFGTSVALLFAWRTDLGTFHANAWANFTPQETFDFFGSVVVEGPPEWPVRPVVEVWVDVDDGDPTLSGLVGAIGEVSDEFAIQGGVRVGGWEDTLDLEIRLSTWVYWELWDPNPGSDDEEDDEEEDDLD